MMGLWPDDPDGDMIPILKASLAEKGDVMDKDRCDRCRTPAIYRLVKPLDTMLYGPAARQKNRPTLTLCNKCWKIHTASLAAQGWVATKQLDQLEGTPS